MKTRSITAALLITTLSGFAQDPPTSAPDPAVAPAPAPPAEPEETFPLVIQARGLRETKPPLFFSARATGVAAINADGWQGETQLTLTTLQGEADLLRVGLTGDGTITSVTGEGIAAWAVGEQRVGDALQRFLEIRPIKDDKGKAPRSITAVVKSEQRDLKLPAEISPLLFATGDAVGFTATATFTADASVDVRVLAADGLMPVDPGDERRKWIFQSFGSGGLRLSLSPGGAALAPVEMVGLSLTGTIGADEKSATFVLAGEAHVHAEDGGEIDILSGHAAVSGLPEGGDFTLRLRGGDAPVYQLVFTKAGTFPVRFEFQAGVRDRGGSDMLDFAVPPGAVVPITIEGLGEGVRFDPACGVFPRRQDGRWAGFLPADGLCQAIWNTARDDDEGKLFFASEALVETRVSAGLLRQTTQLSLKLLQGKLSGVEVLIEGEGEILAVEGANVLGWTVDDAEDGNRLLKISSSQPATGIEQITVRSQQALGDFPLTATPMRLTPQGALRHSGHLRLGNEGAVSLEVGTLAGLTQLAPEQWPPGGDAGASQVFVYRFPSGAYSYQIHADQILPEVAVQQILIYEMTDTDRVIGGRVELDIREAPLREWEILIPGEFAVVSVSGAEVADYNVGSEVTDGKRTLKALFRQPVSGRQLIQFRLEQNLPAAAGPWVLTPLEYPEAKSLRGFVGAATVPGYRATPAAVENLTEVPMAYFPAKVDGLQQTFRLREGAWTASLDVAQLPQSVQADVFHLYSLKEGVAYGSVLLNYFVAGAPVTEWSLEVPAEVGNLAVEGQNVQGWGREEDGTVKVTLHQPTLGAATLLLTFEKPMSARGGTLQPGEVKPLGVAGERGYIQVVSPSQVSHEVGAASPGLLKMEPLELPAEFRVLSNSPSIAVYQYSARPFDLALNIEWFEPGQTVDQVVDFARLESRVSGDGQVVTDAKFYVRTRGRGALRVALPAGANLWEARVNGSPVNARTDDSGQTLIPLPPSLDPNTPVEVGVRLGGTSAKPGRVKVSSPSLEAPTMIATWTVQADPDRLLVPMGHTAPLLTKPVLTETGFAWLRDRGLGALFGLLAIAIIGAALARTPGAARWVGIGLLVVAAAMAVGFSGWAADERLLNKTTLRFVAPVVGDGEAVSLEFANKGKTAAMVSPLGVMAVLLGVGLFAAGLVMRNIREPLAAAGSAAIAFGLLAQRGGAIAFFVFLALLIVVAAMVPAVIEAARAIKARPKPSGAGDEPGGDGPGGGGDDKPDGDDEPGGDGGGSGSGSSGKKRKRTTTAAAEGKKRKRPKPTKTPTPAAGLVAFLGVCIGLLSSSPATGAPVTPLSPDLVSQKLNLEDGRLFGNLELRVTGVASDTLPLLLAPAVLTHFEADGLRLAKRGDAYWLVLERDGTLTATARYELALGEGVTSFTLPTPRAAVQTVDVRYGEPGWEFACPAAVKIAALPDLAAGESGARLTLGLSGAPTVTLTPKRRDLRAEQAEFYVEVANLFIPSPGLVDGRHRATVRPSRGQIAMLECDVPDGFTVSNVTVPNLANWRFDPESKTLHVELSTPAGEVFTLLVETQQGTGPLPSTSKLAPLTVRGGLGSVGTLAVAFGGDSQPESLTPEGLSKVNIDDFDAALLPTDAKGARLATLHAAYRYGAEPGTLDVTAGEVAPEVRVASQQTMSIGDERLVLAVDLNVAITRAGLFNLSFALPEGLEIEAASGSALSHWTESEQDGARVVTLHLNGRTLGAQAFAIQLSGSAPGDQAAWPVPRVSLREATRQIGQLLVVPEQGIRVTAGARTLVSHLDARSLSGGRPGTLAFRLLQADWELVLGLQSLETWVTAQVLQEVTLRDGLTRTRLGIDYKVENAAIKALQLRLPGLTPEEEKTVRATGEGVTDMVKVAPAAAADPANPPAEADDLWEIRFGRRILGQTHVEIEFQRGADRATSADEQVRVAQMVGARQAAYWVALRVSGHLDVTVAEPGSGWSRVDWAAVPTALQDPRDRSLPDFAFRTNEPEAPLALKVQRHAVAEALRLRVSSGEFLTVFSADGNAVTEAQLAVEVVEKSAIEVRLPEGAELMSARVNGETASIVSVGGAYRFYVVPREERGAGEVSLTWSHDAGSRGNRVRLAGPALNLPLQNIRWNVVLPAGYELVDSGGNLEISDDKGRRSYDFDSYRRSVLNRRNVLASEGQQSLQRGIDWRNQGDQQRALLELSKASRNEALAPAGQEDARVQLRELQTEQAVLGLNTRRQKLYLDNADDNAAVGNALLEEAATRNPLLQGQTNYNPQDIDNLLLGNTSEETDALKRIAGRLVSQQLAAEPAVQGINVSAEGQGTVRVFRRSVQVDGDEPLELNLRIKPTRGSALGAGLLALLGAAGIGLSLGRKRKATE